MVGAEVMVLPSTYPAAPATTHPTASPTMILAFFKNGEPNSSVIMMVTNERNPRPMNSGEPHLSDKIRNLNTTPKRLVLRKRMLGCGGRAQRERTTSRTGLTTI